MSEESATQDAQFAETPVVAWWDLAVQADIHDSLAERAMVPSFRIPPEMDGEDDGSEPVGLLDRREVSWPSEKAREAWHSWAEQHPDVGLAEIHQAARSFIPEGANEHAAGRAQVLRYDLWAREMAKRSDSPSRGLEDLERGLAVGERNGPIALVRRVVGEVLARWVESHEDGPLAVSTLVELAGRWEEADELGYIREAVMGVLDVVLCSRVPFAIDTTIDEGVVAELSPKGRVALLHRWALKGREFTAEELAGVVGDEALAAGAAAGLLPRDGFPHLLGEHLAERLRNMSDPWWRDDYNRAVAMRKLINMLEGAPPRSTALLEQVLPALTELGESDHSHSCQARALLERWNVAESHPTTPRAPVLAVREEPDAPAWWSETITPHRAFLCVVGVEVIAGSLRSDVANRVADGAREVLQDDRQSDADRKVAWRILRDRLLLEATHGRIDSQRLQEVAAVARDHSDAAIGEELRVRVAAASGDIGLLEEQESTKEEAGESSAVRWAAECGYSLASPWEEVLEAYTAWRGGIESGARPAQRVLGVALVRANPQAARTLWKEEGFGHRILSATTAIKRHGVVDAVLWATEEPGEMLERIQQAARGEAPNSRSRGVVAQLLSDPRWYGMSKATDEWVEANLPAKKKEPALRLYRLHLEMGNHEAAAYLEARNEGRDETSVWLAQLGCPGVTPVQARAIVDTILYESPYWMYSLRGDQTRVALLREAGGVHLDDAAAALRGLFPEADGAMLCALLQVERGGRAEIPESMRTPTMATWEDWERIREAHGEAWSAQGYRWYSREYAAYGNAPTMRFEGYREEEFLAPAGMPIRVDFGEQARGYAAVCSREVWPGTQVGVTRREWMWNDEDGTLRLSSLRLNLEGEEQGCAGDLRVKISTSGVVEVMWGYTSEAPRYGYLFPGALQATSGVGRDLIARCARHPSAMAMDALAGIFSNPDLARQEWARRRAEYMGTAAAVDVDGGMGEVYRQGLYERMAGGGDAATEVPDVEKVPKGMVGPQR